MGVMHAVILNTTDRSSYISTRDNTNYNHDDSYDLDTTTLATIYVVAITNTRRSI